MNKISKAGVYAIIAILALLMFTGCSSKSAIVGTWQDPSGGTMQFFSDGTFTSSGIIATSGKYSLPDSSHLKFEYEGLLGIAGAQVYEFEIDGNKLVLTSSYGTKTELTKAK